MYKYNTLAMEIYTASIKCQETLRVVLEGLEGVQHNQDDIDIEIVCGPWTYRNGVYGGSRKYNPGV